MKLSVHLLLASQVLSVLALPAPAKEAKATSTAAATAGEATAEAGEEEENANKTDQEGKFATKINLTGSATQIDTAFPPGQNGALEIEFLNAESRVLTVTENKTPGTAPLGFEAVEPVSYKVVVEGGSSTGLTLSKVDYIRNADSQIDISQVQLGRLCTETNTFVVGEGVGEREFEEEESEVATKVDDLSGEFALFVPVAAAADAGTGAEAGTATGGAATAGFSQTLAALLQALTGGSALLRGAAK